MVRWSGTWHWKEVQRYQHLVRVPLAWVTSSDGNVSFLKTLYRASNGTPFARVKQRRWTCFEIRMYSKLIVGLKNVPKTAATMRALRGLCSAEMRELPVYNRLSVPRRYTRRSGRIEGTHAMRSRVCSH
jgi:hypothetical protein